MKPLAFIVIALLSVSFVMSAAPTTSMEPRMEGIAKRTQVTRIAVSEATIREVIAWVRHRTADSPPLRKELNIVYSGRTEPKKRITLTLRDVPLLEVLRAAARQADLQIKFTNDTIYLFPTSEQPPI